MARFGWLIDLDKCTGCDTCTIACKSENNTRPLGSPLPSKNGRGVLPDHVSYRWVVKQEGGVYPNPSITFITSACNHCEAPACLASCPAPISSRRSGNTCPYGAPQFNSVTQKVEKCTLCVHRLYDADARRTAFLPACVTSCVGNALHLVENFELAESGQNAPEGFADPSLTIPAVKFGLG